MSTEEVQKEYEEVGEEGGVLLSDEEGNYYYIPPETLQLTKMPEADVQKLRAGLLEVAKLEAKQSFSVVGGVQPPFRVLARL